MKELATALAQAQGEICNPIFDSEVRTSSYKFKYASLAAVRAAIVPVFAKHGLSIVQNLQSEAGRVFCTTIILHSSGEQVSLGPLGMPVSGTDARGFGSAATYARRYSLMAAAGVVGDEDDDALAAANATGTVQAIPAKTAPPEAVALALGRAAKKGSEEFRKAWKETAKEDREACKDLIEAWKKVAQFADQEAFVKDIEKNESAAPNLGEWHNPSGRAPFPA